MTLDDQNKVKAAGFTIIRKDDYPQPRIKVSTGTNSPSMRPRRLETGRSSPYWRMTRLSVINP